MNSSLTPRILIVDDEPAVARVFAGMASALGYEVETTHSVEDALERIRTLSFDAVLADLYIGEGSGLEIVRQVRALQPDLPIVVVTGQATVRTALDAIALGAYDYISKPCTKDQIDTLLRRAIEKKRLTDQIHELQQRLESQPTLGDIVGSSLPMLELSKVVGRVARRSSTVLITGESGTGKGMVAHAIHANSPRAGKQFVSSQLNAVSSDLVESELFGHVKGAFTGAVASRGGLFQQADGGTLFLDELGELPLPIQGKLLRVIQESRFRPVGSDHEVQVDVRLVTATNRDLDAMIAVGQFREDLYFRLKVITLRVPSLRERREDIPLLTDHFLRRHSEKHRLPLRRLTPDALAMLVRHDWPGNVRELEHLVEEAVVMSTHPVITDDVLPARFHAGNAQLPQTRPWSDGELVALEEIERRYVTHVLRACGGNRTEAARILGVSRRTLQRWGKPADPPGQASLEEPKRATI